MDFFKHVGSHMEVYTKLDLWKLLSDENVFIGYIISIHNPHYYLYVYLLSIIVCVCYVSVVVLSTTQYISELSSQHQYILVVLNIYLLRYPGT